MRDLNLHDIGNPQLFQAFCEELLSSEYEDFRTINDKRGDKGCDGLAVNDTIWFQFYFPDRSAKYVEQMGKVKRKISRDIQKLKKPYPEKWILVTVDKVDKDVHQFCHEKESGYKPIRILVWSAPKLYSIMEKHQQIKHKWIEKLYGSEISALPPEAVTYSLRDNLSGLVDLNAKMGKSLQSWKWAESLKQEHTYDSMGHANVTISPKDPLKPPNLNLQFELSSHVTPQASSALQEIETARKKGTGFEIDGSLIERIHVSVDGRPAPGLLPAGPISKIEIEPRPGPDFSTYLDLFSGKNRLQRLSSLKMRGIRGGTEEILINNREQENERIKVELLVNKVSGVTKLSFEFVANGCDAIDGLRFAQFMKDVSEASDLVFVIAHINQRIKYSKSPEITPSVLETYRISKILQEIEDAIGETVPSLFSQPQNGIFIRQAEYIHSVIASGRSRRRNVSLKFTLEPSSPAFTKSFLAKDGTKFKLIFDQRTLLLGNQRIDVGVEIAYFDARLVEADRSKLNEYITKGRPNPIELEFEAKDRNSIVEEFFPRWMSNFEEAASAFEQEQFPPPLVTINATR